MKLAKKIATPLAVVLALVITFAFASWVVGMTMAGPCEETLLREHFAQLPYAQLESSDMIIDTIVDIVLPLNIAEMHQLRDAIDDAIDDALDTGELFEHLLEFLCWLENPPDEDWIPFLGIFPWEFWTSLIGVMPIDGNVCREEIAEVMFDFVVEVIIMGDEDTIWFISRIIAQTTIEGQEAFDTLMMNIAEEVEQPCASVFEFFILVLTNYISATLEPIRADIIELAEYIWYQYINVGGFHCMFGCCDWQKRELAQTIVDRVAFFYLSNLECLSPSLRSYMIAEMMVRAAVLGLTEVYEVLGATPMELVENVQSAMLFAQLYDALPEIQEEAARAGETQESEYPADYAGAFIDEDNVLHILLTSTENVELYMQAMEENLSSTPVFVQVNHSLNDLLAIQRTLAYAMLELGIEQSEPCQRSNVVEVVLLDQSYRDQVLAHLAMYVPGFSPGSVVFR